MGMHKMQREEDGRLAPENVRWLADVESRDNIFPNIDYRIYAS
jgi:predicted glycosyl hydrolase (DUF1957 family)